MIAQITNLLEAPHIDFQSILLDHDPLYPTNRKKQRAWRGDPAKKGGRITDRLRRTVVGPLPMIFGDREAARRCADRAYHRPMRGINAEDGQPYSAVAADTMLFAAVTISHGALIAYERYAFSRIEVAGQAARRDAGSLLRRELAVLMGVPRERIPVTARQVDDYYRGQAHMYRTRKGYFGNQLRTAASQFRFTFADLVVTVAADIVLLASTFLAYSAIPRPCRRLHHIPVVADPLLAMVHFAVLPLFGTLQIPAVGRLITGAYIGTENVDAIARSLSARADTSNR